MKKGKVVESLHSVESIDVNEKIEKMMVEELAKSIDRQIINDLMGLGDSFESNLDKIISSIENDKTDII